MRAKEFIVANEAMLKYPAEIVRSLTKCCPWAFPLMEIKRNR